MIYITGDTHGSVDIEKLYKENFDPVNMTKYDYVIILGDFGFIWKNVIDKTELYWMNFFKHKPWTTLFIDGNHCNFNRLNQYDVQQWNGGKIHYISDSVIHLMRGQVFTLQGKKFFTFGGAQSYDKQYRISNVSWWQDEIPSYKEVEEGFTNLEQHDYAVDYVLTHTSPSRFVQKMLPYAYPTDPTHKMLDAFEEKLKFKEWFFGHWHMDRHLSSKHRVVYHDVFKLF